jgi:hypothetical protein
MPWINLTLRHGSLPKPVQHAVGKINFVEIRIPIDRLAGRLRGPRARSRRIQEIPRRQLSERGDNRRVPEPILVSIDIGSVKFRFG